MTRDEQAWGYVMGSLSAAEREAVAVVRLSDPELDTAIAELDRALAPMTGMAGEIRPPDHLFDRAVAAIVKETQAFAGMKIETCGEGAWYPYAPGIELKMLWSLGTFMLRCRPGAVLAAHDHPTNEHLLVMSGDFAIGGRVFRAGDSLVAPAGSHHGEASTEQGCLLLVQYVA